MSGHISISGPDNEKRIEWKLHIFQRRNKDEIWSPNFEIFKCRTRLQISLREKEFISLTLFSYGDFDLKINYMMGIKTVNGLRVRIEELESILSSLCYTPISIVSRTELLQRKDTIAPDNFLTVFCNFRFIEILSYSILNISSPDTLLCDIPKASLRTYTSLHGEKDIATSGDSDANEAITVLTEDFKHLYQSKSYADITIKVKNKEFPAHKLILVTRSEVFAAIFQHVSLEKRSGIVEIDCDPKCVDDFLLFLYTADVKIVSSRNVVVLYKTSDKYGCNGLLKECVRFMLRELSVDTFCDYFQIATTYNDSKLLEVATRFFISNTKKLFNTAKWLTLLKENPSLCNELFIKFANSL